jgi:hypothetical protein
MEGFGSETRQRLEEVIRNTLAFENGARCIKLVDADASSGPSARPSVAVATGRPARFSRYLRSRLEPRTPGGARTDMNAV